MDAEDRQEALGRLLAALTDLGWQFAIQLENVELDLSLEDIPCDLMLVGSRENLLAYADEDPERDWMIWRPRPRH